MSSPHESTICLDFDGVIHLYQSPWTSHHEISDPPTPGAKEAVERMVAMGYTVKVNSARCQTSLGLSAVQEFLDLHEIPAKVVEKKPPSKLYVDDRGYRFDGDWERLLSFLADRKNLNPWNKKRESALTKLDAKLSRLWQIAANVDEATMKDIDDEVENLLSNLDY